MKTVPIKHGNGLGKERLSRKVEKSVDNCSYYGFNSQISGHSVVYRISIKKKETYRITRACISPKTSGIPPVSMFDSNDLRFGLMS
jgi:hypothetical protein